MAAPDFWIIAGPNGAGKTTLMSRGQFAHVLKAGNLINPDDITLEYLKAEGIQQRADASLDDQRRLFAKAADEAQRRLEQTITDGGVAAVESVLSTRKYCSLVEKGGHDVPSDKLVRRWKDSLALAPWFAARATEFWLVDNSNAEHGVDPVLLVSGAGGLIARHGQPTPEIHPIIEAFVLAVLNEMKVAGMWKKTES